MAELQSAAITHHVADLTDQVMDEHKSSPAWKEASCRPVRYCTLPLTRRFRSAFLAKIALGVPFRGEGL